MEDNNYDYRSLSAWQKSMELVHEIQRLTGSFPNLDSYNSISEIRKLSVSISSNIANGKKKPNKKEYYDMLTMARQNCYELDVKIKEIKKMPFGKSLDFVKVDETLNEMLYEIDNLIKRVRFEIT